METKTIEKPDFTKLSDNEGFKRCMECGGILPLNEDGSERFRLQPEPCDACIHKNMNKIKCTDGVIRDADKCRRVFNEETGEVRFVKR